MDPEDEESIPAKRLSLDSSTGNNVQEEGNRYQVIKTAKKAVQR